MHQDNACNNPLQVEFRRISLTGFRSCASRSQTGASQSRQSTNIGISSRKEARHRHSPLWASCEGLGVKSMTNIDATDSGPEASVDYLAIYGVLFWHWMSHSDCLDLRSALEFCFVAYVVLVNCDLNASRSNLFADHTTILAAKDACLPAPTPDEVICDRRSLLMRLKKLTRKVSKVGSSVPSVKRTNDVKGSADDVNDVDDQDDAHYHSSLTKYLVRSFDIIEDALAQGAEGLGLKQNEDHQVLGNEQKLEEDASDCTRVDDDDVGFSPEERHTFYEDELDRFLTLAELLKMETMSSLEPFNQ
nr:hypothetical protein [Tanacetum cinerariifolium]